LIAEEFITLGSDEKEHKTAEWIAHGFLTLGGGEKERPFTKTPDNLQAIRNVVELADTAQGLSSSGRVVLDNMLRILFAQAAVSWKDSIPENIPWPKAVDLAIHYPDCPVGDVFGYMLRERVIVLARAPEATVIDAIAKYAEAGGDIVEEIEHAIDMKSRFPGETVYKYYYSSRDVLEILDRLPSDNVILTRSALLWALSIQNKAGFPQNAISLEYLRKLWKTVETKWKSLSDSNRGTFLDLSMLNWLKAYEKHIGYISDEPLRERIKQFIDSIAFNTSPENELAIVKDFVRTNPKFSKEDAQVILRYFPDAQLPEKKTILNIFSGKSKKETASL
jgi:hypothetical protein